VLWVVVTACDRCGRAGAAGRGDRLPGGRQRLGRRAPEPRSRLGAPRRDAPPRRQDLCRLSPERELAELRLGRKTEQRYVEAEKLHRELDRYGYGPPPISSAYADVEQARRRRADRGRARPADDRRPLGAPRAGQGGDRAHPRRAADQGERGGAGGEGRALGQGAGRAAHRGEARPRRGSCASSPTRRTAPTWTSASHRRTACRRRPGDIEVARFCSPTTGKCCSSTGRFRRTRCAATRGWPGGSRRARLDGRRRRPPVDRARAGGRGGRGGGLVEPTRVCMSSSGRPTRGTRVSADARINAVSSRHRGCGHRSGRAGRRRRRPV
jgi:hypothetical protein